MNLSAIEKSDFPSAADDGAQNIVVRVRQIVADSVGRHSGVGNSLAVALSGGADSASLLHSLLPLRDAGLILSAVHIHHGISSNADSWLRLCEKICEEWQVPFLSRRIPPPNPPTESRLRLARYRALGEIAKGSAIAVGHHRDDQIETVLFRLLRGSGVRGLCGISEWRESPLKILRPMLSLSRADIIAYARAANLNWAEDEDNKNPARRRNLIRGMLAQFSDSFPHIGDAILHCRMRFEDAQKILDEIAEEDSAAAVRNDDSFSAAFFRRKGESRTRNWIAANLAKRGIVGASAEQIGEAARQIVHAKAGARIKIDFGEISLCGMSGGIRWRTGGKKSAGGIKLRAAAASRGGK